VTAREALLVLLREHPERLATHRLVCQTMGHKVARASLSRAAAKIDRDRCIAAYGCKGGYGRPDVARPPKVHHEPERRIESMTTQETLAELLEERPGEVISCDDVRERLGHDVSRTNISKVAGRLGRGKCVGILGRNGGYISRVTK